MNHRLLMIACATLGASLLSACETEETADGFEVSLSLRDKFGQQVSSFSSDEAITLQLRVENTGDDAATLRFDDGQAYDFNIQNSSGGTIWIWSDDQAFTQATESTTFAAGEVRTYSVDWDQRDSNDNAVATGSYSAQGEVTANNLDAEDARSERDSFSIQ